MHVVIGQKAFELSGVDLDATAMVEFESIFQSEQSLAMVMK